VKFLKEKNTWKWWNADVHGATMATFFFYLPKKTLATVRISSRLVQKLFFFPPAFPHTVRNVNFDNDLTSMGGDRGMPLYSVEYSCFL
jgi:hypothetical protein